ncbi:MAG: hydroxymethylglutaryl-CoA lyase [Planctomycetes bacterium]|nr:hydroxymethylglutaryl-CoA lyase [Planctomycetota bacterium]
MLFSSLPERVKVYEVGPRDGLQNEDQVVPTDAKRRFVQALARAGLPLVEATSFVHPKWVPQLADAAALLADLEPIDGVRFPVLVPNAKGLERALEAGVDSIAVFVAASESFSRKNTNASLAETFARVRPLIAEAKAAGLWVRAYLSVCWGCPYEGPIAPETVAELSETLISDGAEELSLGDTIGIADPTGVERVLSAVAARVPLEQIALHFHDTRGTALANVLAGLQLGVTTYDASAGGLGGCPYAPGASGNLATEDLLYLLAGLGIETGVDLAAVRAATLELAQVIGRPAPSRYAAAGPWEPLGAVE